MNEARGDRESMRAEVDGKEGATLTLGRAAGSESQAAAVENSMKLLQVGGSSSFLKSMKLARGGNHDSIVRLRCLFFIGDILHWCDD